MRDRFSGSTITVAIAAAAAVSAIPVYVTRTQAQAPAASATAPVPAPASVPTLKTPWGEPDLQGLWMDETDTPCSAPPSMRTRSFSPRRSGPNWMHNGRRWAARTGVRSAGPSSTSPAPTTTFSYPGNTPAPARPRLSTRPVAGFRNPRRRLRRLLPPNGNSASLCCDRPKLARSNTAAVPAANTIRRPRRDSSSSLPATTYYPSIAMMVRRTARRESAA